MATSPARVQANRRNAQLSTGPKTVEGKANSRMNAFQHGMAGAGDLLAPGEDAALVAERTAAFAVEFRASGVAGGILARRAAVLSVRMDQAEVDGDDELLAHVQAALDTFDDARASELDRLVDLLGRRGVMLEAQRDLEQMPDGIDRLLEFWERESQAVAANPANADRRQWLGDLLGLTTEAILSQTPAQFIERIDGERVRLGHVDAATRADRLFELARQRAGVGRAARLDPSPELLQIRRYEAAAERGFYCAVRAIRSLHLDQARTARAESKPIKPPATIRPSTPTPIPVPTGPAPLTPLGSFRAEIEVCPKTLIPAVLSRDSSQIRTESTPKKRRDVRKVKSKRR